ncbi:hypothetical protein [Paraburkholderia sp. SIMBA_054]|uniref:hypothetical protein n=1 Tax=Paraburkholderia sp. SIMBA_054 TaxID=3085795 RepID=UPI00397A196A
MTRDQRDEQMATGSRNGDAERLLMAQSRRTASGTGGVSEAMLTAAMKKGVEVGLFPKTIDCESYLKNWASVRAVLEAALDAQ